MQNEIIAQILNVAALIKKHKSVKRQQHKIFGNKLGSSPI